MCWPFLFLFCSRSLSPSFFLPGLSFFPSFFFSSLSLDSLECDCVLLHSLDQVKFCIAGGLELVKSSPNFFVCSSNKSQLCFICIFNAFSSSSWQLYANGFSGCSALLPLLDFQVDRLNRDHPKSLLVCSLYPNLFLKRSVCVGVCRFFKILLGWRRFCNLLT